MQKKIVLIVLLGICVIFTLFLVGCLRKYYKPAAKETSSSQLTNKNTLDETIDIVPPNTSAHNDCTLIVNGKIMTNSDFVAIDVQNRNATIPLLAVFQELGAQILWENESVVSICFGDFTFTLDTSKEHFDLLIPPGTVGAVRQKRNQEIIIDTVSARGLLRSCNVDIDVDIEAKVIQINQQ